MALKGPVGGGTITQSTSGAVGGIASLGNSFKTLFSGAPNAPIQKAKVERPNRGDYGAPVANPNIVDPNRGNYGTVSGSGLSETASAAREARAGFNDPRSTDAFANLMGLTSEQTGRQEGERARGARDASQRRGYAGGFEDSARAADQDRMQAIATAGFENAKSIRADSADMYGKSIGAFTQLQTSYNEAKAAGDIAFASDLTRTHMANAENTLKTAGLNLEQQGAFAQGLNEAKMLQAKLDQDFNSSLIDNNRYIQGQQQIAAQLLAQQMALEEKKREFDLGFGLDEKKLAEAGRQFDIKTLADTGTSYEARNRLRPKPDSRLPSR